MLFSNCSFEKENPHLIFIAKKNIISSNNIDVFIKKIVIENIDNTSEYYYRDSLLLNSFYIDSLPIKYHYNNFIITLTTVNSKNNSISIFTLKSSEIKNAKSNINLNFNKN